MNSKFSIVYDGVTNYQLKDGKVFPGLSLNISDESGLNVINEADLFASYKRFSGSRRFRFTCNGYGRRSDETRKIFLQCANHG